MYKGFEKVRKLVDETKDLAASSQTMKDVFLAIHDRNLKNTAAIYTNNNGKLAKMSFKEVKNKTYEFAKVLAEKTQGLEKNKPVIIKVNNRVEWTMYFWAILMNGFKPLLLNAKTAIDGTENMIEKSGAVAIVTDDSFKYNITKVTVEDFDQGSSYDFKECWEDEMILCSSGTTGDIKLMIYNGKNLVSQICEAMSLPEATSDIIYPVSLGQIKNLAMLPFHHIFGFVAVYLWYAYFGATIVYPASMIPNELFALCRKVGVTHLYSVPLLWDSLTTGLERKVDMMSDKTKALIKKVMDINSGKADKSESSLLTKIAQKKLQGQLLGSKVKYCISGGGYLNSHTAEVINGVGYPLYNGFGMTEVGVSSVETSSDVKTRLLGSIGKALSGVSYKIKDPKPNGEGELLIKSNTIHVREIIAGVEQPAQLDEEGYMASGDIAKLDDDGRCYIKGRIKDIIINADGENVFPDELELYFKGLDHVSQLSIFGVNKKDSQDQKIVICLEVDNSITEEQLKALNDKVKEISLTLPKGSRIEEVYLAKGKIPISNSMKVKRFAIKKAIESGSDEYVLYGSKVEKKDARHYSEEINTTIVEPLKELFSKVLVLPLFKIDSEAHWINDLGGDSMNYVELVQYINEKFSVTVPEEDYGKMANVNDFVEEIAKLKGIKLK